MGEKYIAMKLKDQERSLAAIEADPELKDLTKLRGPLLDLEVRGPAALQYFGDMLWAPAFDGMAASELEHCTSELFDPMLDSVVVACCNLFPAGPSIAGSIPCQVQL
jgi:hypothetical protein